MKQTPKASAKRQRKSQNTRNPPEEDELASDFPGLRTPASKNPTPLKVKISDLLSDDDEPMTSDSTQTSKSENKRKSEELEDELNSDTLTPTLKKARVGNDSLNTIFGTPMKHSVLPKPTLDGSASQKELKEGHSQGVSTEMVDDLSHNAEETTSKQPKDELSVVEQDLEVSDPLEQGSKEKSNLKNGDQSQSKQSKQAAIPERRSARTKKPTSRSSADDPVSDQKPFRKPNTNDAVLTAKAKVNRANKKWELPYVVIDPKSPLIHTNLTKIFYNPKAWESLTVEEQKELLSYLPPESNSAMRAVEIADMATDNEIPNLPAQRLRRSEKFKSDVRQFQEDLMDGRLDPSWLESATDASRRREEGEFDDWKTKERELYWGMSLEIEGKEGEEHIESDKQDQETRFESNLEES